MRVLSYIFCILALSSCETVLDVLGSGPVENNEFKTNSTASALGGGNVLAPEASTQTIGVNVTSPSYRYKVPIQNYRSSSNVAFSGFNNETKINIGASGEITSAPVLGDGKVFTLSSKGKLTAVSADTNALLWQKLLPQNEVTANGILGESLQKQPFLGGDIAYGNNILYVTTKRGRVYAIDARNQAVIWKRQLEVPIASAPNIDSGMVFFVTRENHTYALSARDGTTKWIHEGIKTNIGIYGSPPPLVTTDKVITTYSNGQIHALNKRNGREIWDKDLSLRSFKNSSLLNVADITARPILSGNVVFTGSNQGSFYALNVNTGEEIWNRTLSAHSTPWIMANHLFMITRNQELTAINKSSGAIKWVTPLLKANIDPRKVPQFSAPVIANSTMLLTSSDGKLHMYNPKNGEYINRMNIINNTHLEPVIGHGKIYLISEQGTLTIIE